MAWQPTTIRRYIKGFPSSARTALVETDVGQAYVKGMGGPEGPHTLASEWVATQLAAWFGLSTFDFAIVPLDEMDEVWFVDRDGNHIGKADPGPAFITRAELGDTWSGDKRQLKKLVNPQDVARLVVFDTWLLNCDRFSLPVGKPVQKPRINRNNVFLSEEAPEGQLLLKAMDHTHCFTCGAEWTNTLAHIDRIQCRRLFGMFPEFRVHIGDDRNAVCHAAKKLLSLKRGDVMLVVRTIPREWDVNAGALDALVNFILGRATFVAAEIERMIWPQLDLGYPGNEEMEGVS
jgi:hypothetical protein